MQKSRLDHVKLLHLKSRIQFSVALSWAYTIYKVQGLTLEHVVVSLNLKEQRSFKYGQIDVALSRATCLQGLYILGEMQSKTETQLLPNDLDIEIKKNLEPFRTYR